MKTIQVKTFIICTNSDWELYDYEQEINDRVNEFLVDEEISSTDLVDIKISTCACDGVYCTVLVIYNCEVMIEE